MKPCLNMIAEQAAIAERRTAYSLRPTIDGLLDSTRDSVTPKICARLEWIGLWPVRHSMLAIRVAIHDTIRGAL